MEALTLIIPFKLTCYKAALKICAKKNERLVFPDRFTALPCFPIGHITWNYCIIFLNKTVQDTKFTFSPLLPLQQVLCLLRRLNSSHPMTTWQKEHEHYAQMNLISLFCAFNFGKLLRPSEPQFPHPLSDITCKIIEWIK